jgi:DMSO/TMAO reductase YedYZ molybdopterin-dependent catalytic subunit
VFTPHLKRVPKPFVIETTLTPHQKGRRKPSKFLIHIRCYRARAEGKLSAVCLASPEFGVKFFYGETFMYRTSGCNDEGAAPSRRTVEPGESRLGRRDFIRGAAAVSLLGIGAGAAQVPDVTEGPSFPGLIVRESQPLNLEYPFATLDRFLTPNERFFVRNHFAIPTLDSADWRLSVEGAAEKPSEFDYAELRRMPSRTVTAMLECAGNGRIFLAPKAKGLLWESGAVGNAEWKGVPLSAVLDRVGIKGEAVEVVIEGHDKGEAQEEPKSPGEIHFARSLPIEKARRDVLLAYQMNGRDLSPSHGFPVRAIVPGWYGMASVKWLKRILLVERPFGGYFQTLDYSYFERRQGMPSLVPVTENEVKSQIARPARHEVVPKGRDYRVHGAAWAGESEVSKVEISTDGGKMWAEATLTGEAVHHAWRLWEWKWRTPKEAGPGSMMARATDERGRVQPMTRDVDRRSVMISHIVPVEFEIH